MLDKDVGKIIEATLSSDSDARIKVCCIGLPLLLSHGIKY